MPGNTTPTRAFTAHGTSGVGQCPDIGSAGGDGGMMVPVDFLIVFTERTPDGSDQRRTIRLDSAGPDPVAAYREASARFLSGSAAGHRYNLVVEPVTEHAKLERV
jgi:hypothetical protein